MRISLLAVLVTMAGCAHRTPAPAVLPCACLVCHEAGLTPDECLYLLRGEAALREMRGGR